jgi:glucose-6-phosphate 1-dehydrogenase
MRHHTSPQIYKDQNPTIFVVFGVTGDLAGRYLIPALFRLYADRLLPKLFQIVGFSRRDMSRKEFQDYVAGVLSKENREEVKKFANLCTYTSGLFEKPEGYDQLAKLFGMRDGEWMACSNKLFYLAVPPSHYHEILRNLKSSGLTKPCSPEEGWTRVVVEKPFGRDAKTAEALDAYLGQLFKEEKIYRIDHYLGKETVQNILAFRFSNSFFEPLWNREHIESIRLQFLEKLGLEGRGSFFDGIGAFRDVGQNHLCQFLAHFTMDNPGTFSAEAIRRGRFEILRHLAIPDAKTINQTAHRGQYEGYLQEKGVDSKSQTETYFNIKAFINTPRWAGVPIYFEGGKYMPETKVQVVVTLKHPVPCFCPPGSHHTYRNVIRYEIKPQEGVYTAFWVKKPGHEMVLEEREFSFKYREENASRESINAYAKLVLDAISGNQTLFVSTEETMASWRFVDPVLDAWRRNKTPLVIYPKGVHPLGDTEGVETQEKGSIGVLGLGKMGKNIALRLSEKGWKVKAYDVSEKAREEIAGAFPTFQTTEKLMRSLVSPRIVWLMVPAGKPVDSLLFGGKNSLSRQLRKGDIIIDGGNSFYKDTMRRADKLKKYGISFVDVGFSGGPAGARNGGSLMIGGDTKIIKRLSDLFADLSVLNGYAHVGAVGAGHFVKMIHNGIEYGMMQSLAEGFAVLKKSPFKFDLEKVAEIYNNGTVIESRLAGWLRNAFKTFGVNLEQVSGTVGRLGEGEWTVKVAKALKVKIPAIEDALQFRKDSVEHPSFTGKVLSALRNQFGGHSAEKPEIRG